MIFFVYSTTSCVKRPGYLIKMPNSLFRILQKLLNSFIQHFSNPRWNFVIGIRKTFLIWKSMLNARRWPSSDIASSTLDLHHSFICLLSIVLNDTSYGLITGLYAKRSLAVSQTINDDNIFQRILIVSWLYHKKRCF